MVENTICSKLCFRQMTGIWANWYQSQILSHSNGFESQIPLRRFSVLKYKASIYLPVIYLNGDGSKSVFNGTDFLINKTHKEECNWTSSNENHFMVVTYPRTSTLNNIWTSWQILMKLGTGVLRWLVIPRCVPLNFILQHQISKCLRQCLVQYMVHQACQIVRWKWH
jgi:hypothetical protein